LLKCAPRAAYVTLIASGHRRRIDVRSGSPSDRGCRNLFARTALTVSLETQRNIAEDELRRAGEHVLPFSSGKNRNTGE
jgi:hypothetical protein